MRNQFNHPRVDGKQPHELNSIAKQVNQKITRPKSLVLQFVFAPRLRRCPRDGEQKSEFKANFLSLKYFSARGDND